MHIWKRGIAVTLAAVGLAIFTPGTARVAAEDLWFEGTVQKSGPTGVTVKVEGFRMGNLYRKPPPSVEILSSEIPAHLLPLIRPGDRIEFKRIKRVVQEKGVEILESLLLLDGSEANRLVLFYGEPLDFPLTDYLLAGAAGKKESRIRMIRFDPIGRTPDGLYSENRLFLTLKRDGKDRRLILDPGTYLEEEGLLGDGVERESVVEGYLERYRGEIKRKVDRYRRKL